MFHHIETDKQVKLSLNLLLAIVHTILHTGRVKIMKMPVSAECYDSNMICSPKVNA